MKVLGIESSAHTFGAGIVDRGKVLANEKSMFPIGTNGMIPGKVAEFHSSNALKVVKAALDRAGTKLSEIEGISYTSGPGLGPCLQIGQLISKTLAKTLSISIAPVNHCVAHIEITRHFAKMRDPLVLYVSGGNSQILKLSEEPFRHYSVLGETLDIGVGNMLDNLARRLGLNPAWGSSVAKAAERGKYINMPYTVKGMDFSFTGILTFAEKMAGKEMPEDICFSVQENAFAMLCEATERAMFLTDSAEICVSGGVAQSRRLKEMLAQISREHGARIGYVSDELNADNGAMVALVGEKMLESGFKARLSDCVIDQKYRTDEAMVY